MGTDDQDRIATSGRQAEGSHRRAQRPWSQDSTLGQLLGSHTSRVLGENLKSTGVHRHSSTS